MLAVAWLLAAAPSAIRASATPTEYTKNQAPVYDDDFIGPAPYKTPLYLPTADGALSGRIIAIDAGHGGYDGGAKGGAGLWEKTYNLQISLALKDQLTAQGATVIMTRDGDYSLADFRPAIRKKRQDMERRAQLVLAGGAELLVSIHQNEYRKASEHGPQVFYRADCAAGKAFAALVQTNLNAELLPSSHRKANVGDFYTNSLGIPSALIECGFLSNPTEEANLRDSAYQRRIASAIVKSITEWFAQENPPAAAARENR
ncbi:MAG: N-acetylmuramoyl-L-alanine amidase [Oscillospiraceae bacterium]|jgi:N-acetylmuramoyl-L-alanine amidase|nr:N-acetylmuramoyl-L-alanine amidase [Oscillospiraceae bacterium]